MGTKRTQFYFILSVQMFLLFKFCSAQDSWNQRSTLMVSQRSYATALAIGNKGYFGLGLDSNSVQYKDFWKYDPVSDTWAQMADFGGMVRTSAICFSLSGKGYVGLGENPDSLFVELFDFWQYDPILNTWLQKTDIPQSLYRKYTVSLSIANKGYLISGVEVSFGNLTNSVIEYDPITDIWTQKSDFPGLPREMATGFSINGKGYIVTGYDFFNTVYYSDLWEYEPTVDSWTPKADFPGLPRDQAIGFSCGTSGIIGLGNDSPFTMFDDYSFWEYIPLYDKWRHRSNFTFNSYRISGCSAFSINGKAYVLPGEMNDTIHQNIFEYTPDTILTTCNAYYMIYNDTIPHQYIITNNCFSTTPVTYLWDWGDGTTSTGATPTHTYSTSGAYNVCLTINDMVSCSDTYCNSSVLFQRNLHNNTAITLTVINPITQSINYLHGRQTERINIYPNPVNDLCNIKSLGFNSAILKIFDVNGNLKIESKFEGEINLNTREFSSGFYIVVLDDNNGKTVKGKLIKN